MDENIEKPFMKLINEKVWTLFSSSYQDTLDEKSYTPDTILKIGMEKQEFYCHRLILITASDFLRKILLPIAPETIPVILLPDLSPSVFELVVKYIYYGEIEVSVKNYAEFLDACKLLELKDKEEAKSEKIETESEPKESENEEKGVEQQKLCNKEKIEEILTKDDEDDDDEIERELMILDKFEESIEENVMNSTVVDSRSDSRSSYQTRDESIEERTPDRFDRKSSILNKRNKQNTHLTKEFIKMDSWLQKRCKNALMGYIKKFYKTQDIPVTSRILGNIRDSRLIIRDNKLIRAIHDCGLCDQPLTLDYKFDKRKEFIYYSNAAMLYHFSSKHNVKNEVEEPKTLTLTPERKIRARDALIKSVEKTYKKLGSMPQQVEEIIRSSCTLIAEDKKLIKGVHYCSLCEAKIDLGYGVDLGEIFFKMENLKQHLNRKHDARF